MRVRSFRGFEVDGFEENDDDTNRWKRVYTVYMH